MALTARIKKRYGKFLLDVEFTAGNGGALALLGVSGCGKSVTLRCLAGIDRPDEGFIELDGLVLFDSGRHVDLPPQKRKIGYLFQQYALFPNMTVEQNIIACLGHLEKSRRQARAAELISALHLEGTEKLLPRQISGGQQQRTALARILASEPRAILLDEPLSALDSCLRWELEMELQEVLSSFGGPAVWVSHDQGEVYRNCARVCVLDHGKSSPAADLKRLMDDPGTVGAARVSGCGNFVRCVPGPELCTAAVPDWNVTLRTAVPPRPEAAVLGVRDSCVRLAPEGGVNAFPCRVCRAVEDVDSFLIVLSPENAVPGAPLLRMRLGKDAWDLWADHGRVLAAIDPENVLLLEE